MLTILSLSLSLALALGAVACGGPSNDVATPGDGACTVTPGGELGHPARETVESVEEGGFEAPSDAWQMQGPGVKPSNVEARTGSSSMVFQLPDGKATLTQQLMFVKGYDYTFSLFVKGNATTVSAAVVPIDTGPPTDVGKILLQVPSGDLADWTELSVTEKVMKNHKWWELQIEVTGPAELYVDDVSMSAQVYGVAPVPPEPAAPLHLNWVIHIEDPEQLVTSEEFFHAKAKAFEEVAKVFHEHDATFVVQPELEIMLGAELYDPTWVQRLTDEYGVTWSVHTHGPSGDDTDMDDVIAYVQERKDKMEELGSGPVVDHNGNFEFPDLDRLSEIGFETLSAYKYKYDQWPAEGYYVNPWRPSAVSPLEDEPGWAVHDRAGKLMFVPGTGVSVLRYKFQLWDYTERYLTSALSKVRANHVNAYSFVDHIDHFYSYTGKSASEYVDSDEFQTDLDYYDEVLGELIAPLVASGHVAWSTNDEIRNAFVEWENTNCPAQ